MLKYLGLAVVLLLLVGGFILLQPKQTTAPQSTVSTTTAPPQISKQSDEDKTKAEDGEEKASEIVVKEFTVTGSNFSFSPNQLTVNKGDKVKITFKNLDGTHDFKIDELNVATKVLQSDNEETIEFTADQAGTFEFYCSVGTHRQMGMKGTLTIK